MKIIWFHAIFMQTWSLTFQYNGSWKQLLSLLRQFKLNVVLALHHFATLIYMNFYSYKFQWIHVGLGKTTLSSTNHHLDNSKLEFVQLIPILMCIYDVPPYMVNYYEHQMSGQLGYFKVVLIICVQLSIKKMFEKLQNLLMFVLFPSWLMQFFLCVKIWNLVKFLI